MGGAEAEMGRKTANPLPQHREESQSPVPRLTLPVLLERSLRAAENALMGLITYAATVKESLPQDDSRGGSRPGSLGQLQGERWQSMLRATRGRIAQGPVSAISEEEWSRMAEGHAGPERVISEDDYSAIPYLGPLEDATLGELSADICQNWLPSIAGADLAERVSGAPPVVAVMHHGEDIRGEELFVSLQMLGSPGAFLPGANAIIISGQDALLGYGEGESRHILLHEQLHYAAWLGGGADMRWRGDDGNLYSCDQRMGWMAHEGLTELITQQEIRSRGLGPRSVNYPAETTTSFYLQQLLGEGGEAVLRTAYFTGDFTEVRTRLDSQLGAGSFDTLMGKRGAAEALSYIVGRMDAQGIDHSTWDQDPIVSGARARMEQQGGLAHGV
ncbi:MAG: hypothetical protein AB1529_07880 [Candidatus Micrarchaeota archaeon]